MVIKIERAIMKITIFILSLMVMIGPVLMQTKESDGDEDPDDRQRRYLNVWAVKVAGGQEKARQVASLYDYELVRPLDGVDDVFLFRKRNLQNRMRRQAVEQHAQLMNDSSVTWAEQQLLFSRVKRHDPHDEDDRWPLPETANNETTSSNEIINGTITMRNGQRDFLFDATRQFMFSLGMNQNQQKHRFNDELWPYQWYLHPAGGFSKFDHGITKVWDMGYTGRGVVVTILDDGLEWNHSDLRANYDHNASFDMNDNDPDPTPRYDFYNSNAHGTRCAGVVGMTPHNKKCGVGAAFNAKIGGIRCLDGDVSDFIEASSLGFRNDYIDIYSSSWGPNDDGMTVDGPKTLTQAAIQRGITFGRKGKGNIYVWASGNGGSRGDNCNCDGYVSSRYTISINSVSESGRFPWYGEKCSSTLAAAFSSGAYTDQKIATTDIHDSCTREHSGTSAAAPLAAAIIALVLEANPGLTWRDVQHLIVCTSEFSPLLDERGWQRNAAGFLYNSRFGFGLLMAQSMVESALNWMPLPPTITCVISPNAPLPVRINDGGMEKVFFLNTNFDMCPIQFLEHVQVRITLDANRRGNIRIFMFSPQDSLSVLMHPRSRDNSMQGFNNWNLTSVHYWGENPAGLWRLYVQNAERDNSVSVLSGVELILHGVGQPAGCFQKRPFRRYLNEELISRIVTKIPELNSAADYNNIFNTLE